VDWSETSKTLLAAKDLTVTATKTWFVPGNLITGFETTKTLTVTTTMTFE
jgi:hypothetical protein